ncbi:MAG: hypothetical protein ACK2VD_06820 [Anaerolineae bacterium]|jgi:hypothetical protein
MMKRIMLLSVLGIALLFFGCTPGTQVREPQPITVERVDPAAEIGPGKEETVEVRLGLINQTDQALAEKEDFSGQWVLRNSDGELRASGGMFTAGPLDPNERSFPLTWQAELDSGTYTLEWGAPSVGTTIVEFQVQRDDHGVLIGTLRQRTTDAYLVEQPAS